MTNIHIYLIYIRFEAGLGNTHSDATSMVLELACASPVGAMVRGPGFLLGAISLMTLCCLFQERTDF